MTWAQFQQLTGFERPPADWTRGAGLDLGSMFAYGLAAIDPLDRWWWIGEFYDEGQFSTKQRGDTLRNRRLYDDGLLVIADPAQKQERQDLLIEANVVTVPAIKDVMLGISQVRKKLERGPDGLPMMIMISDEMAHMSERFEDHARIARQDAARPRAPRTYFARSTGRWGMVHPCVPQQRARPRRPYRWYLWPSQCHDVSSQLSTRFCSTACESAARRHAGVDDVNRLWAYCGDTCRVNHYARTQTCSRSCAAFRQWARQQERMRAEDKAGQAPSRHCPTYCAAENRRDA